MNKANVVEKKNLFGGIGSVFMEHILNDEQFHGMGRVFSKMTLKKDCSLGYHIHEAESETYYVLSGEAQYDDNGTIRTIGAGDITYTPSGCGHGVINEKDEDFVFIALVLFDQQKKNG